MSNVYQAVSNDREVAIKIITETANREPVLRHRFIQEGRLYVRLRHRCIVEGLEHDIHEGLPYMVLEYLDGGTLRDMLNARMRLERNQILALMADLADTLQYIHSVHVIHLDIKPENLFLTQAQLLKLTDFGIASVEGNMPCPQGYVMGTPPYMAPEQIQGLEITAGTDLFAFGITFFELLTGRRPFHGATTQELFSDLINRPLETASLHAAEVPEAVTNLIVRCTAKDPQDRPESAGAVLRELQRITADKRWRPIQTIAAKLRGPATGPPKIQAPASLVEQLARGRCVAFVGAGLSMQCGLPSWRQLLEMMLDYAVEEGVRLPYREEIAMEIKKGNLLDVADELRERLGDGRFHNFMFDRLGHARSPSEAHYAFWDLPFANVITTNYDLLLESAYFSRRGQPLRKSTHTTFAMPLSPAGAEPHLFKLHGSLDDLGNVVFGRADYRKLNLYTGRLYTHLMTMFTQNTVLFLGYSLTDPDLTTLLENMREAYDRTVPNCYALVTNETISEFRGDRLAKNYNLHTIPYDPSDASHPEVLEFLRGLGRSVRERGRQAVETSESAAGEELAGEVQDWLESIGYEVRPQQRVDRRTLRMLAVLDHPTHHKTVRVYCVDGEISAGDVLLARREADLNANRAWIFADNRISPSALDEAERSGLVELFTISGFLENRVWSPYIEAMNRQAEADRIDDLYVDLGCEKIELSENGQILHHDPFPSLDAFVDSWLAERGRVHLSLLGNFGAGKTWFCRHYARRMLQRYFQNSSRERFPLVITLRSFIKSMTAQQMINDVFLEQYKLPFVRSGYDTFMTLSKRGKMLLILDGFDEMALQADDRTVAAHFRELATLATHNAKVILTGRTEYFRWAKEAERMFAPVESSNLRIEAPRFEIVYLTPLDKARIRDLLLRRLGAEESRTADLMVANPAIEDMLKKPVLAEYLLQIPSARLETIENPAHIYLEVTDRLLRRDAESGSTFTTTRDKLLFLCELSWTMLSQGNLRIHFEDLAEHIQRHFQRLIQSYGMEALYRDLRTHGLLHSDAGGHFEFAHKAFAEYFVALRLGAEAGCLAGRFMSTYREHRERNRSVSELPYSQKAASELVHTFARTPLNKEAMTVVSELLAGMIDGNSVERLWSLLRETGSYSPESMRTVSANALQLLIMKGETFRGRDLSGALVATAEELPHDLREIKLRGALVHTSLKGHDLRDADLTGARFPEGTLVGADLRGADGLERVSCRVVISGLPSIPSAPSPIAGLAAIAQASPRVYWVIGESHTDRTTVLAYMLQHFEHQYKPFFYSKTDRVQGSRERTRLHLWTEFATFLTLFGYDRPRELLSSSEDFSTIKDEVSAAFAADLGKLDCLIALDNVEAPEAVELVKFLLKKPEELSATIVIATPRQFVETGMVVPMEKFFSPAAPAVPLPEPSARGEFTHMFQAPAAPPVPPPPSAPDEFTKMFQASIAPAVPPPPLAPGEFTKMFQALAAPTAPPIPPLEIPFSPGALVRHLPADLEPPGEATRMFQVRTWLEAPSWLKPPNKNED